ncbi:MAG: hypothetical protein IPF54_23570 [Draconibacterium sp.]|nr:hypothetical protein [Draconibacterium sp.]
MKNLSFLLKLSIQIISPLLILISNSVYAQVKISEENWKLSTYLIEPADKNPIFFKGESYQGASKVIYPYALNDMISNEKTEKSGKRSFLKMNTLNFA